MKELIENRLIELNKRLVYLNSDITWDHRSSNRREYTMLCENTIKELEELLKKNIKLIHSTRTLLQLDFELHHYLLNQRIPSLQYETY